MAVGFSLAFGVMRIVNFAHGAFIMLGAYAAYWGFNLLGIDPLLALPGIMLLGAIFGYVCFWGLVQRVLDATALNQIVLMFGIALALQELAVTLWSADTRSTMPTYALSSIELGEVFISTGRLLTAIISLLIVFILFLWLRFSEYGRAIQAVAQSRDTAILMGINVRRAFAVAFSISTALGAACGATVSIVLVTSPYMGFPMLIKAVAIVILGGMGSIAGTFISAGIVAVTETAIAYFVPDGSGWAEGAAFLILVTILVVRPKGIIAQAVEI